MTRNDDPQALGAAEQLAAIERGAERLAATLDLSPPGTPVVTCGEWDLAKLVRHTGLTHRWAAAIVAERLTDPPDTTAIDLGFPDRDAGAGPWAEWMRQGARRLVELFSATPQDTPVWSWGRDQRVAFWSRRMAHETTMHAADAALALGQQPEISMALALDGLDELLANLARGRAFAARHEKFPRSGTVHLHATDDHLPEGTGEWMIEFRPDGYTWAHGHGKGDAAVKGPAVALELLAYGRMSPDDHRVQVFGDADALGCWLANSQLA
ncbi:MAG: maleylpyruvate isomerase family mycothiol-dependent enzyme [Microthrixaceae bacterium]